MKELKSAPCPDHLCCSEYNLKNCVCVPLMFDEVACRLIAPEGLLCRAAIKIHVRTFVFVRCLSVVVCLCLTFVTLSIRSDRDLLIIDIIRSEVNVFSKHK